MFASSLASAIILRKRAPLRGGSDTCYLGKAAGGENWRPQGYSLLIFCLTHTVTHTGKRADGNNGVNRSRPHPFWRKKHRKALHGKGWKAFKHLVRMRSAVRIRPAAPENPRNHAISGIFLIGALAAIKPPVKLGVEKIL